MLRTNRTLVVNHLLLRIGLVLAVFVMLTLPHPGMTAVGETPAMTVLHSSDVSGQIRHSGGVHEKMNGALCAMLCAGLNVVEGPVHLARSVNFVFARWSVEAGRVWAPVQPDPAQRPPDALPQA